MKPSWDEAPEWANWLAMDESGNWFWYQEKPVDGNGCFVANSSGKFALASYSDWEESLERRP